MYKQLADIIEKNIPRIAKETAEHGNNAQLYNKVYDGMVLTLEVLVRYIRSDDLTEMKQYLISWTSQQIKNGVSREQLKTTFLEFNVRLINIVNAELPGPENERLRTKYSNRLKSLLTLADISAHNAQFQSK